MCHVFLTGDIHNSIDISKLSSRNFPLGKTLTKKDIVIILGDAGLVWDDSKTDMYWRKWLNEKPWTTFCVLGNHENFSLISKLPETTMFGNTVKQVEDSVFYANSGLVYDIYGYKCLVVNGADSHDKEYRIEGKSWWSQERISLEDVEKAIFSLKKSGGEIDYLFTHTGGVEVCKSLCYMPTISDYRLERIKSEIKGSFKHYCGHYHVDMRVNKDTKILYDDIVLLHNIEDDINDSGLCSIFNGIKLGKSAAEFE